MTALLLILFAVTPAGSMSAARFNPTMTLLSDGRVLVAGGSTPSQSLSSAEIYDPATRTFRATLAPMANAHVTASAVLFNDGRVMIDGGAFIDGPAIEIYNPASDNFSTPEQPASRHLYAPLLKLPDGRILLAGGTDAQQVPTTLVEIFDPATGHWSKAANLAAARYDHAEVLFADGKVLMAGGRGATDFPGSELYDPAAGTSVLTTQTFSQPIAVTTGPASAGIVETTSFWTFDEASMTFRDAIPSLPTTNQAVSRLTGGPPLLAGGVDPVAGVPSPSILAIDPIGGTFTQVGALSVARTLAASVTLGDGSVLIAGGQDAAKNPLASAELFRMPQRGRAAKHH